MSIIFDTKCIPIACRDTSFLDCIHKHVAENGAPPDKFCALYRVLHTEFHGFHSRIVISGLSYCGSR